MTDRYNWLPVFNSPPTTPPGTTPDYPFRRGDIVSLWYQGRMRTDVAVVLEIQGTMICCFAPRIVTQDDDGERTVTMGEFIVPSHNLQWRGEGLTQGMTIREIDNHFDTMEAFLPQVIIVAPALPRIVIDQSGPEDPDVSINFEEIKYGAPIVIPFIPGAFSEREQEDIWRILLVDNVPDAMETFCHGAFRDANRYLRPSDGPQPNRLFAYDDPVIPPFPDHMEQWERDVHLMAAQNKTFLEPIKVHPQLPDLGMKYLFVERWYDCLVYRELPQWWVTIRQAPLFDSKWFDYCSYQPSHFTYVGDY